MIVKQNKAAGCSGVALQTAVVNLLTAAEERTTVIHEHREIAHIPERAFGVSWGRTYLGKGYITHPRANATPRKEKNRKMA